MITMNKKGHKNQAERSSRRLWITLLFFCFTVTGFMQAANAVFAQTTVTATFKNATLSEVLWEVQRQTDFTFVYSTEEVKNVKVEKLIVNHEKIANVLDKCLKGSGLTYTVHDGVIAIKPASKVEEMAAPQQKTKLNGTVVDETGEAIIGANVIVKGTTNGCTTDLDGHFTLDVDHLPATLMVSYIGYIRQEIKVTSAKTIKVEMAPDNNLMDEVVITGYGTFKKSAYAGSAASVKGETLKDVPAISFKDLLQGNAPGVQFTSSSGQPGASSSLRIRGMGSFNASNSPLYVIDGVPMRSGTINTMSSDAGLDIMSTINSSDIESVTVIKDAAAASLYGSRAANGVVLITTKKGKAGKPSISLKADWGSSDFAMDYRPIMGGEERRQYIYDGLVAGQIKKGKSEADAMAYADGEIDDYAPVPWCGYTDWDDVLFKKGNHQSYEASLSGGTDRFKYYSSLSYLKQDGIAINSGLERISGRLNVDFQATSKLKLGANVLFATVNQDVYSEGTSYSSPFYTSRNAVVPSDPIYNEDGSWNRDLIRIGDRNPLLSATYDYQREYVTRTFNTIYGEYEFIKDLKFKSTFSYDYVITKGKDWSDPRTSNGDDINGGMSKKYYEYNKMVWANQVSYKTSIARDHHIDALVGYEIDDQYRDYLSGYATNFATHDKNQISNGMKTESVGGNDTRTRMVSYLTRLNYDYKNKYQAGSTVETCPAELPEEVTEGMQRCAEAVYRALRLHTYVRADFRMDREYHFYCLEANTLPGMTPTSLLPQEAAAVGVDFDALCEEIIRISLEKYNEAE